MPTEPNLWLSFVYVMIAAGMLWKGADWLVEAATRIARSVGVSDVVIGLTVVAFGTSAPEFAVTVYGALKGEADIPVANVVGSNVFNLGFILGGCAALIGMKTTPTIVYRDGSVLIAVTMLLYFFLGDGIFSQVEGAILFTLLVTYIAYLFLSRGKAPVDDDDEELAEGKAEKTDYAWLVVGLIMVLLGGHLMLNGAVAIATYFGMPQWAIGVTIVAAATSLPEFATSMMAIYRGRHGLSVGNLIGSDLFNLLGVLGVAGMLGPLTPDAAAQSSVVVLVCMVTMVVAFMRTGWKVSRGEGAFLVALNLIRWYFELTGGGGSSPAGH